MKCIVDNTKVCSKFPYDHYFKMKICGACETRFTTNYKPLKDFVVEKVTQ